MISGNQDWEVKSLDDLDIVGLQALADFLNSEFPGTYYPYCTPEAFNWKLGSDNPAGAGFITVAVSNGQVIGVFSLTRKTLTVNGMKLSAGEIGDAFTHPRYRRGGKCITPREHLNVADEYYDKSIFGRLVAETLFRARAGGVEFVYGTPNAVARPSYLKRLGFTECSNNEIYSKYLLTRRFNRPRILSPIIYSFSSTNHLYCKIMTRVRFGKNAIKRIEGKESIIELVNRTNFSDNKEIQFGMHFSKEYFLSRYVNHPTIQYLFFEIRSKNEMLGLIIACEVVRASGMKTLVVSDWLLRNPKFSKSFHIVLGSLRGFTKTAQTISLWQGGKTSRLMFPLSGMFSRKKVSIVGKSLLDKNPTHNFVFQDFHFGWSDNG